MFRPCPSYPGFSANKLGEILRDNKHIDQSHDKHSGYLKIRTYVNGEFRALKCHLLVADAFLGPRPPNKTVDHLNRRRDDNRLENLRYATILEQNRNRRFASKNKAGYGSGTFLDLLSSRVPLSG